MIFYVVKHETFENENVIFLNKDIALEYIKKRIKELNNDYGNDADHELFKIIEIKEGYRFDAYIQK
jgi:hypothetical protein